MRIKGKLYLSLLGPVENNTFLGEGLKAENRSPSMLDTPVLLLDESVQVRASVNPHRLWSVPRAMLHPLRGIAAHHRHSVAQIAAGDANGPAMTAQTLA
ncbi:hypothetical protein [Bradyrhizobium sp. 172]|uniref:hypothetical protein n=1 Tax=Bradyrhizobium sp. 172 TaxID=2782643 RepID=UPI001FFFB05F|nr:hypothetical protein [Bradyrhizobium sp. 172]UPJ94888.1 hypothetical protein IVB07_31465 [Bradyrhizobium sp. 172]